MQNHVSFPGLGIHNLTINSVAFELNIGGMNLKIMWYGLIIAVAFLLCLGIALSQKKRFRFTSDDILDCFLWGIPLSIVGARLYYVAFAWDQFKHDLSTILQVRNGGMAFYGGIIGGIIALLLVSAIKKRPVSDFMDFFAPYLALGQAIGRWGNFVNQEAFGGNTTLPWGMVSEGTAAYLQKLGPGFAPLSPVHPTFFYEFLGNIIIFIFLLEIRKRSTFRGETSAWYLAMYGILRYFVEGLRTDPLMIGNTGLRVSQVLSALMVVGSILFLFVRNLRQRKTPEAEWVLPFEGANAGFDLDDEDFIAEDLSEELTEEASEIADATAEAKEELEQDNADVEEGLGDLADSVENKVGGGINDLSDSVENEIGEAQEQVKEVAETVKNELAEGTEEVNE